MKKQEKNREYHVKNGFAKFVKNHYYMTIS